MRILLDPICDCADVMLDGRIDFHDPADGCNLGAVRYYTRHDYEAPEDFRRRVVASEYHPEGPPEEC